MKVEDKAKELINKFKDWLPSEKLYYDEIEDLSIELALICIEEIMNKDGYNNHIYEEVKEYLNKLKK